VAGEFVAWLGLPPGEQWLDVGCGTEALSQVTRERGAPEWVSGIDASEGFVAYARRRVVDGRCDFRVGSAQALPVADVEFGVAVAGLVLNFIPDKAKAVAEMKRATRGAGTVAAYDWDYAGEMQMMRHFWNAAGALDPTAVELDEGRRFPTCHPDPLADLFRGAGQREVETRAIEVPTVFKDFEDYWSPFLVGLGATVG